MIRSGHSRAGYTVRSASRRCTPPTSPPPLHSIHRRGLLARAHVPASSSTGAPSLPSPTGGDLDLLPPAASLASPSTLAPGWFGGASTTRSTSTLSASCPADRRPPLTSRRQHPLLRPGSRRSTRLRASPAP